MSLPRRAIPGGAKVLIIDDFMKAGGTAKGMLDLAYEVGALVVGCRCFGSHRFDRAKTSGRLLPLLILHEVDEHNKRIDIRPAI